MAKITINGKEYDPEDLPENMDQAMKDGFSGDNGKIFVDNNIVAGNKVYKNINDLPPELREKIQKNLGKLQNIPFAKNLLKMYGLNMDNSSGNNQNQFGGSQFSGSQFNNPSGSPLNQFNSPFFTKKSSSGVAVLVAILVCIGGFVGLFFAINTLTSSWEETFELQGDPTHFDPIAAVNEMRSHIDPNAKLSEISISYVRADGTMDLKVTAYRPSVEYDFYRELATPPKDAPPVGAGGTTTGKWYEPVQAEVYEPGQWRHVTKIGGGVSTEYSYANKGIDLDRDSPTTSPSEFVDDPTCKISDFWKTAIKKGAPADAVARVDYDHNGYDFSISDANINLEFDKNCKLKGDDVASFGDEIGIMAPEEPVDPAQI